MKVIISPNWKDYSLLDSGNEKRLEKFGPYILVRPDPQCIWKPSLPESEWKKADAVFELSQKSGERGNWKVKSKLNNKPSFSTNKWRLRYKNINFWVKLSPFKHTGVFPEQAIQWEFISKKVSESVNQKSPNNPHRPDIPNVLNLFGYTGIATLAAAAAGAKVTHVDASYPTIGWAKENQKLSGLEDKPIRWILDDALKFCQRELKRGVKYDGIIMDPPIYGHGPHGEKWEFNESFPKLMEICSKLLTDQPLFVIVNAYAISASAIMLENVLSDYLGQLGGEIESGELVLQEESSKRLLSTGIFARSSM